VENAGKVLSRWSFRRVCSLVPTIPLFAVIAIGAAAQTPAVIDHVVVYKHDRKLVLFSQGKEMKSYRVALGGNPVGPKTRQGDHRTPEGSYILDSRNPHSQFYKAYHISYPNAKDIANAKRQGVRPGGDIMLHGLPRQYAWVGKGHTLHDWTDGCIAVTNEEMDEIWKLVPVGTPIQINQ
jgi:murein L,D-transpeptidase YafK